MNRDDIVCIAKEAGFTQIDVCPAGPNVWIDDGYYVEELERFAALVVAAEKQKVVEYMNSRAFATGHGDTIDDLLKELEWQVAEREREACAKVTEDIDIVEFEHCMVLHQDAAKTLKNAAAAIRARGEP